MDMFQHIVHLQCATFLFFQQKALYSVEIFDKTNLEVALDGIRSVVVEEWGVSTLCQVNSATQSGLNM